MGFTDKMCYDVAKDIINKMFWPKYITTVDTDISWYKNLNNFLVVEWDRLQEIEESESEFDEEESHMITRNAMEMLLDRLQVDEDEFEDTEQEIDWMKFDDIIGDYMCNA